MDADIPQYPILVKVGSGLDRPAKDPAFSTGKRLHGSQNILRKYMMDHARGGQKSAEQTNGQKVLSIRSSGSHRLGLRRRERHRFFTQNRQPGLEELNRLSRMILRRRSDDHQVKSEVFDLIELAYLGGRGE